jgi:predicted TIM-barrel fold metal-dependent hydrolase
MKVVDAHVHLWDPHRLRYSWLDGTELDRVYELLASTTGAS